ncbi:HSP20-like chaperone, partial [Blyttiomyces helicus]
MRCNGVLTLRACPPPLLLAAPAPAVQAPTADSAPVAIPPTASFLTPTANIRHEWFQNENFVTISVFVKKLVPEAVTVDFSPRALSVTIRRPGQPDYSLELDLAHEIDPSGSKFAILSTKIEIKIKKERAGIKWGALEGEETGPVADVASVQADDRPVYPSSSKKKHDWDRVAREVEAEKPEGEQALNALFQNIYKDASDDVKRAMLKSYQESNGTCLSTNWAEVGRAPVPVTPPEGMIAKKYDI